MHAVPQCSRTNAMTSTDTWAALSIPGEQVEVVPDARTLAAPSPAAPVSQLSLCAGYAKTPSSACPRLLSNDPRVSPPS